MRLYVTRKKNKMMQVTFMVIDDGVIYTQKYKYRIWAMKISHLDFFMLLHKYIPTIGRFLHKKDIYVYAMPLFRVSVLHQCRY